MFGLGDSQETVTTPVPMPEVQPYIAPTLSEVDQLAGQTYQLDMDPWMNPYATDVINQTLMGDFFSGEGFDNIMAGLQAQINAALPGAMNPFIASGRSGGLAQNAVANTVSGNIAMGLMPFIENERARQVGLASDLNTMAQQNAMFQSGLDQVPFQQQMQFLNALFGSPMGQSSMTTSNPGMLTTAGTILGGISLFP